MTMYPLGQPDPIFEAEQGEIARQLVWRAERLMAIDPRLIGMDPEVRLDRLCDRLLTVIGEAESLVTRLRTLTESALTQEAPPTENVPPIVHFNGPIHATCDRVHDVIEDHEFYVDLTKKDPTN